MPWPLTLFSQVYSICSSFWLLTDESRDLSPAKKKITIARAEQIHKKLFLNKMTIFDQPIWVFFFNNLLSSGNSYFDLSLRQITWFISLQPKTWTNWLDLRRILWQWETRTSYWRYIFTTSNWVSSVDIFDYIKFVFKFKQTHKLLNFHSMAFILLCVHSFLKTINAAEPCKLT